MRVVVFASQKGGSGKTTLAGHVAVQAERAGAGPVAIIDTDRQGSLSDWWNVRDAEVPIFARTTFPRLISDLESLSESGVKLTIIDTPPAITLAIRDVIVYANLVVVPTRPSPHDLRAVGATIELVEAAKKPLIFVINAATKRARITADAAVRTVAAWHGRTDHDPPADRFRDQHDRRPHCHGSRAKIGVGR